MKLVSFSITNYRSITTAHKIAMSNLTVLVGKNNEGKSNILNALNIAMMTLIISSEDKMPQTLFFQKMRSKDIGYDWFRDFPMQFQCRKIGIESIFTLLFRLEGSELDEFHREVKIGGNEDIPIRIKFGKDNGFKIEVPKRGSSAYNKKSTQIASFISKRISFNYIKAIRTENMAIRALINIIREELYSLKNNEEYRHAYEKILELQQLKLDSISSTLLSPLKVFLPKIQNIKIVKETEDMLGRASYSSDFDIIIDDGTPTSINYKGDGIKSLVSLAILKERTNTKPASIIAIEEPESHLHSEAIHSLCDVINRISEKNQVILTTHNPLFVQQNYIKSNIIVDKGEAHPAKSIAEIRDVLGVLAADNLSNANKVVVVEGEDDKIYLTKILSLKNTTIDKALKNNSLVILPLFGASNLSHVLYNLQRELCQYVVLLDNDSAGKDAYSVAESKGLINSSQVKFTICNGMISSEIEDCIKPSVYKKIIFDNFGVTVDCKDFKGNKKWSDRMRECFYSQGSPWNDTIEKQVKWSIANTLPDSIEEILIEQKSGFIDGLINIIESSLLKDVSKEQSK